MQLLRSIYSTNKDAASLLLLFPDAMLFPRLFPATAPDGTPLGALPFFMFYRPHGLSGSSSGNLANLLEHANIRTRNPFLPTSKQQDYRAFLFCLKINAALNSYPLHLLMRRGPEDMSVRCRELYGKAANYDFLPDDEGDMHRRMRDVCAMIREYGYWNYFITITCNDQMTPSVSHFIDDLKAYFGEENLALAYSSHLPIILLLWERYVKLVLRWITKSKERPLGHVSHYFARWEFQSGTGRGNKPHLHFGIITDKKEEPVYKNEHNWRIACDEPHMFHTGHGKFGQLNIRSLNILEYYHHILQITLK